MIFRGETARSGQTSKKWFCRDFSKKDSHYQAVQQKESSNCTFKVLNITFGVSLRAVRTAVAPLLLFERMQSPTKGQQVYLADGESRLSVL